MTTSVLMNIFKVSTHIPVIFTCAHTHILYVPQEAINTREKKLFLLTLYSSISSSSASPSSGYLRFAFGAEVS